MFPPLPETGVHCDRDADERDIAGRRGLRQGRGRSCAFGPYGGGVGVAGGVASDLDGAVDGAAWACGGAGVGRCGEAVRPAGEPFADVSGGRAVPVGRAEAGGGAECGEDAEGAGMPIPAVGLRAGPDNREPTGGDPTVAADFCEEDQFHAQAGDGVSPAGAWVAGGGSLRSACGHCGIEEDSRVVARG